MNEGHIRIGKVTIDSARGRLARAGRQVALDRAATAILKLLAEDAGNDIDKDCLIEAGWPGRVVHENSLAKAIARLREGFGADAGALQTVHGYGYRLDAEPPARANQPAAPTADLWRKLAWPLGFIGLSAALVLALKTAGGTETGPRLTKGEPADSVGRLLWVDDHPQNNAAERRHFEARHIAVYQVKTTEEALQLLAMYDYGAVISDMNRNDKPLDGIALVKEMRRRGDHTPFVLYSVVPSEAQRLFVAQAGGQAATVTRDELYDAVLPLFERS